MHKILLNISAKSPSEAQVKAKYIEKLLPHLDVESLKILASKANAKTNEKIKKYQKML